MLKDFYIISGLEESITDILDCINADPASIIKDIKEYPELFELAIESCKKSSACFIVEYYFNDLTDSQKREFIELSLQQNYYAVIKLSLDKLKLYPDLYQNTIELVKEIKETTEDYLKQSFMDKDCYKFLITKNNKERYTFLCQFLVDIK